MARIKGGMNARKKHNRTLKLAQSCKTVCNESTYIRICRKKAAQTSDETALDCTY